MTAAERNPKPDDFVCGACGKRVRRRHRNVCLAFGCGCVVCNFCSMDHWRDHPWADDGMSMRIVYKDRSIDT